MRPDSLDRTPAVKLVVGQQLIEELAHCDTLGVGTGHGDEAALGCLELPALLLEDFARLAPVGRPGRGADDAPLESDPVPPEATVWVPVQRALPTCCLPRSHRL